MPKADLPVFRGKIEGKSTFTRGAFIALNDISIPERQGSGPGVRSLCGTRKNQNAFAPRVEGKGHSPQRIDARPPQLRPELLEQMGQSQNLRPHVFVQPEGHWLEFIANLNAPPHSAI